MTKQEQQAVFGLQLFLPYELKGNEGHRTETISLLSRPNLSAEEKERLEAEYAVLLQQKQKLRQNPAKKNKRPLPSH